MKLNQEEIKRYSRHLIMPEFGMKAQEKLKDSSVLIVGAGGLGCPLALYLGAAGVGKIGIVDFDTVDYSNLQRQVIYNTDDVGKYKADATKAKLEAMNPHIEVEVFKKAIKSDNALEISKDYKVIIDGTDNFPTRYLVNDLCAITGKTNVFGSIFRFDGQVTVFDAKQGPCYRCLYPDPPPAGMVPSCAEGGVLGILPGVVGVMQATEAIKVITGIGEPLIGRLLTFDALNMKYRELKIRKDPTCPVCSAKPTLTELIDYEEFCGVPVGDLEEETVQIADLEVNPEELKELLDSNKPPYMIDVRNYNEYEICFIEGAHQLPLDEIQNRINEVPQDQPIITICHHGQRSLRALEILRTNGIKNVKSLRGGVEVWASQIDSSMARY